MALTWPSAARALLAALGSVASSLVLARLAYYHDRTRLLLWHYALYGACMVAFAVSTSLPLSVVLMAGTVQGAGISMQPYYSAAPLLASGELCMWSLPTGPRHQCMADIVHEMEDRMRKSK